MSICTFEINFSMTDKAFPKLEFNCSKFLEAKYDIDPGDKTIISIIGDVVSNFENTIELTVDQSITQSDNDKATFSFDISEIVTKDEVNIFYKKIAVLISDLEAALVKYKI